MSRFFNTLWSSDQGQDIAEYAVMLAVILVLVVGTIRLVGSNSNIVWQHGASSPRPWCFERSERSNMWF